MTSKILALFSETAIDLFPGQGLTIENDMMKDLALSGPDFIIRFAQQPFPGEETGMNAVLDLAPISALRTVLPSLQASVALHEHPDGYMLRDLGLLSARIGETKLFDSLSLAAGTATLALGLAPWRLALTAEDGQPVGRIALPGTSGIAFDINQLTLDASGVASCAAALVPGSCTIGALSLYVGEGTLAVRGTRVEARLKASFELDYFAGASIDLQLTVAGDLADGPWTISGLTHIGGNAPWRDPSGLLTFDQMSATVDFTASGAGYTSTVRIGGRVAFAARSLPASVEAWFGRLFSGLTVTFADLTVQTGDITLPAFTFSPPESLRLKALEIFQLNVPTLAFGKGYVILKDANIRLAEAGAVLSGTIGDLKILLDAGPSLELGKGRTAIDMELATPGGFKGQARLVDISTPDVQAIRGEGRISSPALAPVEATFTIGSSRRVDGKTWRPVVSIMVGEDDVNIPLFPGVVITRIELGAGINRHVAGVTKLSLQQAQQRLRDGLPDVFKQESWEDHETALTMVARLFVESSQTTGAATPSLYVADMTLLMTSEFQFAAFGKLWFYTSRGDARTAPFQQYPSAVGLAMFDGQQPSLRVVAMTHPDGRSTLTDKIPAAQLLGMRIPRSQLAFEATPAGMALVLGPVEVGTTLGPLQVAGSTLFALRSAGGRVYAISRSSLSASFSASTRTLSVGPASLSGSINAGFAATLGLLGHYANGALTIYGVAHASCWVELALHVRIGFSIRIRAGFVRITISWHQDWDFNLRMHVDLDLEATLTSDGGIGIDGRARIEVNVLGIGAALSLQIAANDQLVRDGRAMYATINQDVNQLLGA